jgi:transposase
VTKLPEITIDPERIDSLPEAKKVIGNLLNIIEDLMKTIHQMSNDIQLLKEENTRLRKQSRPPTHTRSQRSSINYSSDKLTKEKRTWEKHEKKPLLTIDREEQLPEATVCSHCGSFKLRVIHTFQKIVQGLIIKRDTVLYRGRDKQCQECGIVLKATMPESIKGNEFSRELCSWVSVFTYDFRMSKRLVKRFLAGVGIQISNGQITNIIIENSTKLKASYNHLRIWGLKLSVYVHADATGFFSAVKGYGKRIQEHVHFVGHKYLSVFAITKKYTGTILTAEVFTKKALARVIYISDAAGANGRKLLIRLKQLCWIHEIRHYLKLNPTVEVHKQQVAKVLDELWEWYKEAKEYGRDPTKVRKKKLSQEFYRIMNQKTGYTLLDTRLGLTKRKRQRLLLFLEYPGLPIENNLAERDLRSVVILRKLSGGTKSVAGDRSFERHMSVIQTARKQELNVFDTFHGLLNGEVSPFILTRKTLPALVV